MKWDADSTVKLVTTLALIGAALGFLALGASDMAHVALGGALGYIAPRAKKDGE
jgi:hypothetical protein